jgi:phosphatidyl-myo-inositol dimannoside synthase
MSEIHILTHEFRPKRGGAGMVCEKLAETLARTNHSVTVWAPEYVATDSEDTFCPAYNVRAISGLKGTHDLGCLLATARQLLHERSMLQDAILYLGEPGPITAFLYLTLFYRPFWKKLIITMHGSEIERFRQNPLSAWLFRRFLKKVDIVHVLSSYNADKLTAWIPDIRDKLVKGYGMMLPGEELPLSLHPKHDNPAKVHLLCVGRIHPRKGQLQLLQAISGLDIVLQRQLKVRFAGQLVKDSYFNALKQVQASCHADIEFMGGLTDADLVSAYETSDIFALTSVPYRSSVEGLGLVYLEAARYGLPILAHNIGGVSDVVAHGRNGYLVDPVDLRQLTAHLDILIRNSVIRKQFGEAGREMVMERKWEAVTSQLFDEN